MNFSDIRPARFVNLLEYAEVKSQRQWFAVAHMRYTQRFSLRLFRDSHLYIKYVNFLRSKLV